MKEEKDSNTSKTTFVGLKLPNKVKKAVFKRSLVESKKAGKKVSEHKLMVDAITEKYLPQKSILTGHKVQE